MGRSVLRLFNCEINLSRTDQTLADDYNNACFSCTVSARRNAMIESLILCLNSFYSIGRDRREKAESYFDVQEARKWDGGTYGANSDTSNRDV